MIMNIWTFENLMRKIFWLLFFDSWSMSRILNSYNRYDELCKSEIFEDWKIKFDK